MQEKSHALSQIDALGQRNDLLESQAEDLEARVRSFREKTSQLESQNEVLANNQQIPIKPLGRKSFLELGPDAVNKTKAAYKDAFFQDINTYGEKRGLEAESLILRDKETGKQLQVGG